MSAKEDYLDSLLQTVNDTNPSGGSALQKLAEIQGEEKKVTGEDTGSSFSDVYDMDELEFPELEMLFGEKPEAEPIEETEEAIEEFIEEIPEMENVSLSENSDTVQGEALIEDTQEEESETNTDSDADLSVDALFEELLGADSDAGVLGVIPDTDSIKDISELDISGMDISELESMMANVSMETNSLPAEDAGMNLFEDGDVTDLLNSLGDEGDLAEISELLRKSDNNEMIEDSDSLLQKDDMAEVEALLAGMEELSQESESVSSADDVQDAGNEPEEKKVKKERKRREKKEKKEKPVKEDKGEKKQGIFSKFISFLAEEDDLSAIDAEISQMDLSQENIAILKEIDNESTKGLKRFKKDKAPKEKKEKKPKEKKKKEKKEKKPKEKKPKIKKEKAPKIPLEPEKPLRPLGKKRIMTGIIFGLTVFGMIMLFTSFMPEFVDKRESRKAYKEGDYRTVYDLLITKDVKGDEARMLKGATLCMQMERKLESYENYKKLSDMEVEQLHALISGVDKYHKIRTEAQQYGVEVEVKNLYLNILGTLQAEYGVSEEKAIEIAAIKDDVAYTKELMHVIGMKIPTAEDKERKRK